MLPVAAIRIGIDPLLVALGPLQITWHGVFTLLGIVTVVILAGRRARKHGIPEDAIYNTAAWALIGGVLGARLVHVVDFWHHYLANPLQILNILGGGIGLIGGILGATIAGGIYLWRKRIPVGLSLDVTAPGVPLGQWVGRWGDIINGEHFAVPTDLPWSFVYTHPGSPSFGLVPQHPAIAYEMIWDLLIASFLFWIFGRLRPAGMVFASYLALYALGRFTIQFYRLDAPQFAGLQEAHLLALAILVVTVPLLVARARWVRAGEDPYTSARQRLAAAAAGGPGTGEEPPLPRRRSRRGRG